MSSRIVKNYVSVTLPLLCRNHAIWHPPRGWHLPIQVGRAYDYFHLLNCEGSLETISVWTRCLWFSFVGDQNQQRLIFCQFYLIMLNDAVTYVCLLQWRKCSPLLRRESWVYITLGSWIVVFFASRHFDLTWGRYLNWFYYFNLIMFGL